LSALIQAVISAWRSEHPDNSNEAARRKLLEHSSALSDIDNRWETARLAASQAEREQQEFEREYHNFRSIPARHKQLTDKAASLKAQRKELTDINFDARIKQLLELEYNAKVGTTIHGSAPAFLLIKQTLPIRLEVIDSLTTRIEEELAKLSADNERLAAALDLPEHKL
jgi:predicted transcriptional regulator